MLLSLLFESDLDNVDQVDFQDRISMVHTICNVHPTNLKQDKYNNYNYINLKMQMSK